jgi:hypothetical protein
MQPLSFDTTKNVVSVKRLKELGREYDNHITHMVRSYNVLVQEFQMRDLEGVDLMGRKVIVWARNYEDSQWLSSRNVLTVNTVPLYEGDDPRYPSCIFIMAKTDDQDSDYEQLRYTTFWSTETVLVITEL